MPELPEVESVRRQLDPELRGRLVTEVWSDPIPSMPRQFHQVEAATGHRIARVDRRGKFLISPLDGDMELVLHLGMTGVLRFDLDSPHVRARLTLDDGRTLCFKDVRRFGRMAVVEAGMYEAIPMLAMLGPEPLSDDFDPDVFAWELHRTTSPIKPFLLSQRPVAGVGNIYADEALWLARIHPASRKVGKRRAYELHAAIRSTLRSSIEREGTTFSDYQMVNGASGRNASALVAYGQNGKPCPRCATPMKKIVLGGRGTTYCPRCQRP